jgi:hypothetical protein
MNGPDPALHDLARRVIRATPKSASATAAGSAAAAEAMQSSCGELYRVLDATMGPAGLQALLARAIQIAARDHPWLARVTPGAADCIFPGLTTAAEGVDVDEAITGSAALLATILWLLVTFIGEELTLRFVRRAWPQVSLHKLSEERVHES